MSLANAVGHDPFPIYESLRSEAPVVWDQGLGGWLALSYEACHFVERREDLFQRRWPGAEALWGPRTLMSIPHGPAHRYLHTEILAWFRSRARDPEFLEAVVDPVIESVGARLGHGSAVDLWTRFSDEIPTRVMLSLIGLRGDDDDLVRNYKEWGDAFVEVSHTFGRDAEVLKRGLAATEAIAQTIRPLVEGGQASGSDTLIGMLWEAGRAVFEDWDVEDVVSNCRLAFVAGSDTTAFLINNLVYGVLLREAWGELRDSPERAARVDRLVEETLRTLPPAHVRIRVALADVVVDGVQIREGDYIHPVNGAANRDPDRFECPAEFRTDRARPADHFAFNKGPRSCVGAPLARAEAARALLWLLARYEHCELNSPASVVLRHDVLGNVTYRPLDVHLRSATSATGSD